MSLSGSNFNINTDTAAIKENITTFVDKIHRN